MNTTDIHINFRTLFFIIFFISLLLSITITSPLQALDASIGINTWYSKWDFDVDRDDEGMEFDPAILYGPLLSLKFNDEWGLSTVFLYGTFKSKQERGSDIDRYDSDTSINYSITNYLKVFAGIKFMGFLWEDTYTKGKHRGYGPGGGIALTAPISDRLFFLFNVSGLYLNTKHEQSMKQEIPGYDSNQSQDVVETGFNSMAAIAYYFPDISTSLTLGFRAQYVKMDFQDEDENSSDSNMLFYGITLSAVYSFEI